MKKSIFLMAGLIGLALTSCDDKSDLGTMQKNESPVVVPADGVALKSIYATSGNNINLQNFEESVYIPLLDIEISSLFPEGTVVTGDVEVADNPDFTDAQTISLNSMAVANGNSQVAAAVNGETRSYQGYVDLNEWEAAFTTFYGLNPAPKVNYLRYRLWLTDDTQKVILYDNKGNEWYDAMEFMVTPLDSNLDVAAAYNLTYSVGGVQTTIAMYHNPANHQYDDPVFNAMVEVSEEAALAGFSWTISPADNAARVFGVAEGTDVTAATGFLSEISEGAQPGQIMEPGSYKIEANMLDHSFMVQIAPQSLYVMYSGAGAFTNVAQLGTDDYITYKGMAGILGVWGLAGQPAYKPTLYVNDPSVEATTQNGTKTGGLLYDNSGTPINANTGIPYPGTGAALYYITANLQTLTYTGYQCKTVGITGSMEAQNWGAGADVALKGSRTTQYMEWTGTLTVAAGDEWKIRMNSEWVVNFGAADDGSYVADGKPIELAMDGANFVAAEDGTYNVTVYFKRTLTDGKMSPYYLTLTPAN